MVKTESEHSWKNREVFYIIYLRVHNLIMSDNQMTLSSHCGCIMPLYGSCRNTNIGAKCLCWCTWQISCPVLWLDFEEDINVRIHKRREEPQVSNVTGGGAEEGNTGVLLGFFSQLFPLKQHVGTTQEMCFRTTRNVQILDSSWLPAL